MDHHYDQRTRPYHDDRRRRRSRSNGSPPSQWRRKDERNDPQHRQDDERPANSHHRHSGSRRSDRYHSPSSSESSVDHHRRRRRSRRSRSYSRGRRRDESPSSSQRHRRRYDSSEERRDRQEQRRKRRRTKRSRRRRGERDSDDDSLEEHDDDDHSKQPPRRNHHRPLREPPAVSDDEHETATAHNSKRHYHKSKSPRSSPKQQRRGARNPNRSPSSHDDTVGHFQGGPGTVISSHHNHHRYIVERQVGMGTFGRVLECRRDLHHQRQGSHYDRQSAAVVAIKVVRSVKRYCESAKIEASIVGQINRRGGRGQSLCVMLHDAFDFQGHFCLVFERLGPSLYDFLKRHDYRAFPMICIQDFAVQLLETMEFLHSFGLIHTDLKIENILLLSGSETTYRGQRVPESTRIKLIDFGGACYDDSKKSCVINTRQYRAPEVILEAGWSMPTDMFSIGCILAELYRGELLFPTHENVEHLALMERALGHFPKSLLRRGTKFVQEAFDGEGRHRLSRVLSDESVAYVRNSPSLDSIVRNPDDFWFLRLLSDILQLDPEKRATARECLYQLSRIQRNVVRCA